MAKKLTEKEKIDRIESKGLKFIEGDLTNHDTKIKVMCICGNVFGTTLRIVKNSNYLPMCEKCRIIYKRNLYRNHFDKIKKSYKEKACILLSKEEDYVNVRSKMTFIASCGHEYTSSYCSFVKSRGLCYKCSVETNSGENAYNWNGGYDSENIKFRKTYEFKRWVKLVFKRDNYTCQCCKKHGGKLNSHHLDGYNWCIEKRTDVDNGITLCKECHNKFHNEYGRGNNTKEQYYDWLKNKI